MARYDVLIVGAGQAGAQAAITLRQHGFAGSIGILGAEPELPYERPPLTKEYLSGEKGFDRLLIRPAPFWEERQIEMLLGRRVMSVDPASRTVTDAAGNQIGYGALIWAAGGMPRNLVCAGNALTGVHTVRDRRDVDRMRGELDDVSGVVVVGGGYVGLEAAAVLTKLGKRVVLLEALDRVLARVAAEPLSRFYENDHRAHGVDIRLNAQVECVLGEEKVIGVQMADGEIITCDMVVVGVGIVPSVEPLLTAGADGGNGVSVDAQCRTSLPDIFAVGDCARHANRYAQGEPVRIESVQNANDQATVAAKTIAGIEANYDALPWFWSNQYDLRLQTVGLSVGYDDVIVRGDPASRSFSVVYLRKAVVIAIDCVNATRDYAHGRKAVVDGLVAARERWADSTVAIKDLFA